MRYRVRVIPNAKRPEVILLDNRDIKVKVDAQAEEGKANKRLMEILANYFNVPKNKVMIVHGAKSRLKTIEVKQ